MERYPALRIVFIIIFCSITFSAVAQPALPDIEGKADSDNVTLLWTSPYTNIKSIAVLRSHDSINYATIGNLYKVGKGKQEYVDEHPAGGNNYYKLTITFSSGLNWTSNHCGVRVNKPGDTIQAKQAGNTPYPDKSTAQATPTSATNVTANAIPQNMAVLDPPLKRFVLKTNDTVTTDMSMQVPSEYIFIDSFTGNINIFIPEDLGRHHYSVKFYNDQGVVMYDIPRITVTKIIMDKRNFQQKGIYKFIIRRDIIEFDSGYLRITPN